MLVNGSSTLYVPNTQYISEAIGAGTGAIVIVPTLAMSPFLAIWTVMCANVGTNSLAECVAISSGVYGGCLFLGTSLGYTSKKLAELALNYFF